MRSHRRNFLKTVGMAGGLAMPDGAAQAAQATGLRASDPFAYPRQFTGRQLAAIAFPLGGIGTGSVSLGGRGQLCDWEIFNRPDKGRNLDYCFAAIRTETAQGKSAARVLEAALIPPYQGAKGLLPGAMSGLLRFPSATFTGEFPFASIAFRDPRLPVRVRLEAFSPFIPLDAENSGLPVAILRYRVSNPGKEKVVASVAFSVDNPVGQTRAGQRPLKRVNEYKQGQRLQGFVMRNLELASSEPEAGTFTLALLGAGEGVTHLRGWPAGKWWSMPLLFWDDFTGDGEVGPEAALTRPVATLCLKQEIQPGAAADYTFLLAWHFPNRTPARCGWRSPKGQENTWIGNYYCTRFADSWAAAEHVASNLESLEARTRLYARTLRESTLPNAVKDAASATASTLVTQTCFRAADGRFYGFEGCDDQLGCCFGNCTHVWNYDATTQFLFPALARSMRETAFLTSAEPNGMMHFRQLLPAGSETLGIAAADGQMGQVVKAYLDWRLCGDRRWLETMWPAVKRALEFAWAPGGWDADRDGVMEGVQHNTYDVEFFGPNPQCGVWYLAALRAGEEMARAVGDIESAGEYQRLFRSGSQWIDANLFNGHYYVQKIRGEIAPGLMTARGADDPEHPEEFQVGEGCLADQLVGQWLAFLAGLGYLLDSGKVAKALASLYALNYKKSLEDHESVQRIYALGSDAGMIICDYSRVRRPLIPFPYYAEVWTGLEYSAAALMMAVGQVDAGVECVTGARRRHDGERRNPWDEPECGHHYARAMSAWSPIPLLSGFLYHAGARALSVAPRIQPAAFRCFWSTGTGWGSFQHVLASGRLRVTISAAEGTLPLASVKLAPEREGATSARLAAQPLRHKVQHDGKQSVFIFEADAVIKPGSDLVLEL